MSSSGRKPSPSPRSASPKPGASPRAPANGGTKPSASPRKPSPSPRKTSARNSTGPSPRPSNASNRTPRSGRSGSPAPKTSARLMSQRSSRSLGPKAELEDRIGKQQTIITNRVHTVVRLRPPSIQGESEADLNAVEHDVSSRLLWVLPGENAPKPDRRQFDADGMIGIDATDAGAFAEVRETVDAVLANTPGCVVSYGASGTGKSRTLFAPEGLVVHAARHLLAKSEQAVTVSIQFVEVYMETLTDLLDKASKVTLREGGNKTIVHGATTLECKTAEAVGEALVSGQASRSADDPRSAAILIMQVSSTALSDPQNLYFVDLPSINGIKLSGAEGVALAPTISAYTSLETFERTLAVLADKKIKTKPPLRASKLTRVLTNVFTGGGKMSLIVHIALGVAELALTLAALEFAQLAMRVSLKEAKNEKGLDADTVSKNLQTQIDSFDEAAATRHAEVEAELRAEMARAAAEVKSVAELQKAVKAAQKRYAELHSKLGKGKGKEANAGPKEVDEEEAKRAAEMAAETHKKIMEMRAQVDAARKLRDEVTVMLPEIAAEYRELGGHAWHNGDTAKTEMYYDKALAAYTKCMGKDHPEVACSMGDLANVYCDQSRFAEAISLYQQAYKVHTDAYGPDHVDTAGDLASLGLVYSVQGNHKAALPLLKDAYAIMDRHLEDDHPNLVQVRTFMEKSEAALK